ncbi:hypothetical protein GAGA_1552 [Paraglaciecola agarilytica NO2]|uniref:Uncharacterized protein n=1 Tax=Paraglaciecola agarilytica NO2 TaxID=1125747 RepID=A0ABQ0I520_9ALTE|nr:hypothetical protein GAGA_1552 [Paraglaciecola agarilytica NO2]
MQKIFRIYFYLPIFYSTHYYHCWIHRIGENQLIFASKAQANYGNIIQ